MQLHSTWQLGHDNGLTALHPAYIQGLSLSNDYVLTPNQAINLLSTVQSTYNHDYDTYYTELKSLLRKRTQREEITGMYQNAPSQSTARSQAMDRLLENPAGPYLVFGTMIPGLLF